VLFSNVTVLDDLHRKYLKKRGGDMNLHDRRWGRYHIYEIDGTPQGKRVTMQSILATSDNQALGNYYRGNSKKWPKGAYARRVGDVFPHSREEHKKAAEEAEKEEEIHNEAEQLTLL
jgi:hypothetical protein